MQLIDPDMSRRTLIKAALLAALIGLSGCMIVPFPNHQVYEGTEIKGESLQWLRVGETTRAQVLERFGSPNIDFVDRHVIAYMWSGQSGGVFMWFFQSAGIVPIEMRRALLIRFDTDNKVAAFSIIGRQVEYIPYDVQPASFDAKYDDWNEMLDLWLADHGQVTGLPETAPK